MNANDKTTADTSTEQLGLPSRRTVLGTGGAVGLALLSPTSIFAQGADGANTIRVGFISPRTGALASFGEADGYVLDLARKSLKDGLTVGGKKYAVEILDRDTQSDPARASQLAKTLINSDKVDLILVTSAPETVNPVADACEGAGVPCLSTVTPWEAWYFGRGAKPGEPSPFKWTFHFSFGVGEFVKSYTSQWGQLPNNKKVAALYPNDADGNAIRASLVPALQKAGFTVVDAGPYETGTTDFSAQIAKFKAEKCDIFNTFPIPPDFAKLRSRASQRQ
jgi:branched-chain amino acid transport system substrate-binding protein